MNDSAAKDYSESWTADECGPNQANQCEQTCRWTRLLMPENGGPGEPPGREEAIERAKQRTEERYALHGKKKAKGSKKAVKNELGRPRTRELGL